MRELGAETPSEKNARSEVLAFRGLLYDDLRFQLRRSYSTYVVYERPTLEDQTYSIELRDGDDKILNTEFAGVTPALVCAPNAPRRYKVSGYIALRAGSVKLLFSRDDVLIESFDVPPSPKLSVNRRDPSVSRDEEYKLTLEYSEPYRGAYMQILYQWGETQSQTLDFYPPSNEIPVDISELPGGERCRFVIRYSNGLRSVDEATDYFSLPPLEPRLEILRPMDEAEFAPWVPIELRGQIVDVERVAVTEDEYVWLLNDEVVLSGPAGSLDHLAEGKHVIALEYRSNTRNGETPSKHITIFVRRPDRVDGVPGDEWDD